MLASAVGGLLTRTLVSSQVECVTENACVYSFLHANVAPMRLECGKTFLLRVYTLWLQLYLLVHCDCGLIRQLNPLLYGFGSVPVTDIYGLCRMCRESILSVNGI